MAKKGDFKTRLAHSREIEISVTGRKSGRTISVPVWFALDGETLYLLPVKGSSTQWYQNVLKKPAMSIAVGGANAELNVIPVTDHAQVETVVEKFREKYGARDVKKYYSKFDVAVRAHVA